MKSLILILMAFACLSASCKKNKVDAPATVPLIENGTYSIINVSTQDALTPVMLTAGQNVFLQNQVTTDLLQRWYIQFDGLYYTIRSQQENTLFFQPFPAGEHTSIISSNNGDSSPKFLLEKIVENGAVYFKIKSVLLAGQALYQFTNGLYEEARFKAFENTDLFKWQIIKY